jgi:hypothetical protein
MLIAVWLAAAGFVWDDPPPEKASAVVFGLAAPVLTVVSIYVLPVRRAVGCGSRVVLVRPAATEYR